MKSSALFVYLARTFIRYELCSFFLFPFPHIITVNIFSPSTDNLALSSIAMYFFVYYMPTQHLHPFPFGTPDMSHLLKRCVVYFIYSDTYTSIPFTIRYVCPFSIIYTMHTYYPLPPSTKFHLVVFYFFFFLK